MNRYYRINITWDPSISGVDGAQVVIFPEGFEDKGMHEKICDFFNGEISDKDSRFKYFLTANKKPDFNVVFQCMQVKENANLTNVLSYEPLLSDCEFLIDEDVKEFLENFNISEHYLYEAKVCYMDMVFRYWMFHIPYLDYDVIDFNGSIFYSGPRTCKEYVQVNSLEEYKNFRSQRRSNLTPEKLSLNEKFDKTLDFFSLRVGSAVFVSERLRDEFLMRGLTGVEFTPAFGHLPNEITLITGYSQL